MLDDIELKDILGESLHCTHDFDVTCEMCRLRGMCLPAALSAAEINALESLIELRRKVPAREHIYRAGEKFECLYAVIYGSVKTYITYDDGRSCVTGFHLPGEVFGFSGIEKGVYSVNATALQDTGVCEIPFGDLERSCRVIPGLQLRLLQLMSDRIIDYQQHFAQLRSANVVQKRVAALLISLSSRSARRGESLVSVRLPMTGDDVSSFLGISAETLSREFSRLSGLGVIAKHRRDITIMDLPELQRTFCDGN